MNAELIKIIERVYNSISSVSVTGDAVDVIAIVRHDLRTAFSILQKEGSKDGG